MKNIRWSSLILWSISVLAIELLPGLGSFALEFAACVALRYSLAFALKWMLAASVENADREVKLGIGVSETNDG